MEAAAVQVQTKMELALMEILREAPPWFMGWIAVIPCMILGGLFLYYGIRYRKEEHVKTLKEENLPAIFRIMPWWFLKLTVVVLGLFILGIAIGYFINVPEHFF